jgi:hypothetical protein
MPLLGTRLMPHEICQLARDAGWRDESLIICIAVCFAESSGYTKAYNDQNPDGSTDYGLMQINSVHIGQVIAGKTVTKDLLYDPAYNMAVAHELYKARSYTFRAWAAYTSDRYKLNLESAIKGVANYWRLQYGLPTK